jgi:hypothetical protein
VIYVDAGAATEARPGDDFYAAFLNSYIISDRLIA